MRRTASLLLTTAMLALLPTGAGAETFTVNKRGDHAPGGCTPDDCTLREAVATAASQPTGPAHKIKLPSKKPYRLTRSASNPGPDEAKGDLDLSIAGNWSVWIVHPGPGRAKIDASAADDRVLELDGGSTLRKIVIRGGTVTGFNSGGGIHASGDFNGLTLERSKVVGNQTGLDGGGIFATIAHLRIEDSVVKGNTAGGGGGVFATEDVNLQVHRSTVTGNLADDGDGGGLWVGTGLGEGASTIADSTIAGNETLASGGGIANDAWALNIRNSTLTKNRAAGRGGGIFGGSGTSARLNGVTIARNRADTDDGGGVDIGGGIYADGGEEVVTIQNSLLAKNRSTAGAINECWGPSPPNIGSLGGNLITSTGAGCDYFDHPQDIVNPAPLIAKLKDAGGPTKTIPLKAGSPAINQADGPDPLERDQRGKLRKNPDIGAFER